MRRSRRRSSPENNVVFLFIFFWAMICGLIFTPLRAAGVDVDHAPVLGTIVGVIGLGITGLLWWGLSGLRREREQRRLPPPPPPRPTPPPGREPLDPSPLPLGPRPRPVNRQAPIDKPYPFRPY
jgi:hypothetical protein